ncbi:MAG: TonB-dependent receptor [Lautropia sp.]
MNRLAAPTARALARSFPTQPVQTVRSIPTIRPAVPVAPPIATWRRGRPARVFACTFAVALAAAAMPAARGQSSGVAGTDARPAPTDATLPTVIVTGNPLGAPEIATPASVLDGAGLRDRPAGTLGDTLDGLPGVSQTGFGPNASRPIIRGLGGDRIRILRNQGASFDASGLSDDHAVPVDPLLADRIEVLRGPAALLYGGSAQGGVVNTIDNRIPSSTIDRLQGRAELRAGGADRERAGSMLLEGGTPLGSGASLNVHADAALRDASDLRTPEFTAPDRSRRGRLENSASRRRSAAFGASLTGAQGYLGASIDSYDNRYGVVVEPEATIRMHSDRVAIAGERRAPLPGIAALRFRAGAEDYEHKELEGGEVGTVFRNRGSDLRVEAEHAAVGPLTGVIGLQLDRSRFSALGEEAFVPSTRTRSNALFLVESLAIAGARVNLGARAERIRIGSSGDAADAEEAHFGPATERRFTPTSLAADTVVPLAGGWQVTGGLARTQRAPTQYELFADGVHVATGAFERGDPSLGIERSTSWDLALGWKRGPNRWRAGVFGTRYSNYIDLARQDADSGAVDEDGEPLPLYAFEAVPARLHGFEIDGNWRVLDAGWRVDLLGRIDSVRATNRVTGEPLARIAPLRATAGLQWQRADWSGSMEVIRAAAQRRVPAADQATPGYTLIHLSLAWRLPVADRRLQAFARVSNLTDELAYNAAAVSTIRALSPLGGRALLVGLRGSL